MAEASLPLEQQPAGPAAPLAQVRRLSQSTAVRLARYIAIKILVLAATVVTGVYLTILIANMGGYVDNIRRGQIREGIILGVSADPAFRALPTEQRNQRITEMVRLEEDRLGLNSPFLVRSLSYLTDALTLSLGRAEKMTSDSGSKQVRLIILERLPPTLLLFATANVLGFLLSVFLALRLSRGYGSVADRTMIALSPLSSAPGWFFGIFLILIFAAVLDILPFGGMIDAPPPAETLDYVLNLVRHLILPVGALLLSTLFGATYAWRTFFLIYSSEEYVDMAKAKGLSSGEIERRYILRPTMPNIITNFALTLITLWQGAIILETVFNWPGLGRLFFRAIGLYDTPVIVGSTVIYAYLLALTVLLLDFVYALVDPRVQIGGEERPA